MNRRPTNIAFELLKNLIITKYNGKSASGGKEVTKRCHYCGDSHDRSSRHMYIGISKNSTIVYNCFKCNARGIVDLNFFNSLGEYDSQDVIKAVLDYNNIASKSYNERDNQKRNYVKRENSQGPIINYSDDQFAIKKLAYINKRLGVNFSFDDLKRFKIILNLENYLKENKIVGTTRAPDIMNWLSYGFIGFISITNEYVTMRRVVKKEIAPDALKSRYINYNIFNKDSVGRFYAIPVMLDMSRHIDLHIAEGPFDILAIYRDHVNKFPNSIWIAICGKNYGPVIASLISELGLIDFSIHIYPDNDFTHTECHRLANNLNFTRCPFYEHRNTMSGEKDFGVDVSRIKETITRIR